VTTIALLGCAHIHTPGFIHAINKRTDSVQVKFVWDHDIERAHKAAAELAGAQVEGNLDTILADRDITAVIICSETNRHVDLVVPTARAGKALFVEKPLGFATDDAFTMAAAIEEAGVAFQTGYFRRGDAQTLFLKQQLDTGAFGKVTRVRMSNCHSGALGGWFDGEWRWMADPTQSGVGAFGDLGTHALDILLWYFGEVATCTAQIDPGTARYAGCDETGEGLIRFKSGVIATLAASWDDIADPVSVEIAGTEGHAVIVHGKLYFESKHVEGADGREPWSAIPQGVPAGLDSFLDRVTGDEGAVLVGAREAAYRSSVMESLYLGAAEGRWITPRTE
jgi:predicted dehydrogenase